MCEVAGFKATEVEYVTNGTFVEYDDNNNPTSNGFLIELKLDGSHVSVRSNFNVKEYVNGELCDTALSKVLRSALRNDADYRARLEMMALRLDEIHAEGERRSNLLGETLEANAKLLQKLEIAQSNPNSGVALRLADILSDALTQFVVTEEEREAQSNIAIKVNG